MQACPLLALSGHGPAHCTCPLLGVKPTGVSHRGVSTNGPKRAFAIIGEPGRTWVCRRFVTLGCKSFACWIGFPMDSTAQEIALLAVVGVIAGLLPSTIAERRGIRLAAD